MDNSDILINVINECVEKALQKSNIPTKTMGTVTSVTEDNTKATVKIGGFDSVFELINKSGEVLSEGDSVFVESIGGNLTNGFISERFGIGRNILNAPNNRYIGAGGAINMNNSDIINANCIYMNDEAETGEGIMFLKQGRR